MAEETQNEKIVAVESEESASLEEEIISITSSDKQTTVTIYRHYCKGCEICAEICPKDVLRMAVATDRWEGTIVEIVDIDSCNACMLCEYQCPDFAIEVFNVKKEQKKKEKKAIA